MLLTQPDWELEPPPDAGLQSDIAAQTRWGTTDEARRRALTHAGPESAVTVRAARATDHASDQSEESEARSCSSVAVTRRSQARETSSCSPISNTSAACPTINGSARPTISVSLPS